MRRSTAFGSPILSRALIALSLTSFTGSFRATKIRGSVALTSPIWPRASAEFPRTSGSSSSRAWIRGPTALGSPTLPRDTAALARTSGVPPYNRSQTVSSTLSATTGIASAASASTHKIALSLISFNLLSEMGFVTIHEKCFDVARLLEDLKSSIISLHCTPQS